MVARSVDAIRDAVTLEELRSAIAETLLSHSMEAEATERALRTDLLKLREEFGRVVVSREATEEEVQKLQEEVEKMKERSSRTGDEGRKDRKRSEPKEAFTGSNLIDWEWRLNSHMESCFGDQGRQMMKWIRERAKKETVITLGKDKTSLVSGAKWIGNCGPRS